MEAATSDTKPPYGGFGTYWNFVAQLGEHGDHLPQRLDRSVMGNRGGSTRAELYGALRFFRQMDDEKRPTPELARLVLDPSKESLRALVEEHYAPVIGLHLESATPAMVDKALTEMGATPSTVRRARTFFLSAADTAGIKVGKLLKARAAAGTGTRRKPTKPKPPKPSGDETGQNNGTPEGVPEVVRVVVADLPPKDAWKGQEDAAAEWLDMLTRAVSYGYKLDLGQLTKGRS